MTGIGFVLEAIRDSVVSPPSDDAMEAVDEFIPDGDEFFPYLSKFTMLIVLSAGIAAFGLLADSSAVVIGAMLVAPLMTPITAAAAATVMARNVRLVRSLFVIGFGTVAAIAVGYLTALLAGTEITGVTDLPGEVRARTFPGLLDLGVAVTAGAAADYILPRRSTISALPGVGIAVALVPPLATVGITLEVGAGEKAANAFLLYATNLAAIVFSASVMLILAGFRPRAAGGAGSLGRRLAITLFEVESGSFDDLAPGTIAVVSAGNGPALGDTVTVADNMGDSEELEVVAVMNLSQDTLVMGDFVDTSTFDSLVGDTAPTVAFIDLTSGAETDTTDAIEARTKLRPDINLTEGNALGRLVGQIFDFIINAVNGLLMMSVIVALIGIVNTLSLSILERRRELGLLRAVGMTDQRVKQMVRLESVLIAALGTISGIVLGVFVGWGLIRSIDRLSDANVAFSFPVLRLLLVLVLGIVLGVLASLIPARRSTRLDVLDAIQAT